MRHRFIKTAAAVAIATAAPLGVARAHNSSVHQSMTDYAYEALRAASLEAGGGAGLPGDVHSHLGRLAENNHDVAVLYADAVRAVAKLRDLPSGLPPSFFPCQSPFFAGLNGGSSSPDWNLQNGDSLAQTTMAHVVYPVGAEYGTGTLDCGVAELWTPGGVLDDVNPGTLKTRDHTGVTLGYWAQAVDNDFDDWHVRSTMGEALQNPIITGAVGAGVTGAVSLACLLACGLFPPACVACPVLAIGAGVDVMDSIQDTNFTDMSSPDFVGFGHFIDVKSPISGPLFDDKPGKLGDRSGPNGVPDMTEGVVTALFDIAGVHVRHDTSNAPKDYEILLGSSGAMGADVHLNTTHRSAAEWESLTVGHTELTAVDNLAMFGWQQAEGQLAFGAFQAPISTPDSTLTAQSLGGPLHALGDATVPHHTSGASGWGHRPYEDAMASLYDEIVSKNSRTGSLSFLDAVIVRAVGWRAFITSWRAAHPALGNEVPVRDLVTALASSTFGKSLAHQADIFDPNLSLQYQFGDSAAATAAYETATMKPIYRDLLLDGIAAKLAFLLSTTEVMP